MKSKKKSMIRKKKTVKARPAIKKSAPNKVALATPLTKAVTSPQEAEQPTSVPEKQKYAFFIGCTIKVRAPYIERLARQIFDKLGVQLVDLEFSCCPTSHVIRDVDINTWLVIAARNLALAEKEGLPILSMCTGCTQTLMEAKHMLEDSDIRKQVNSIIKPLEYQGTSEIKFYAQLLHEKKDTIPIKIRMPLNIAGHAGCHILRPSHILQFDNAENPVKLDDLIILLGADPIQYPKKTLCCGYPLYAVDQAAAESMMQDKISSIQSADCMTVLCPTCFEYYQLRMPAISQKQGFQPLAVLHYLQLLGLSMGLSVDEVGWQYLRFKDDEILRKIY